MVPAAADMSWFAACEHVLCSFAAHHLRRAQQPAGGALRTLSHVVQAPETFLTTSSSVKAAGLLLFTKVKKVQKRCVLVS
jgi:hypothetical protein